MARSQVSSWRNLKDVAGCRLAMKTRLFLVPPRPFSSHFLRNKSVHAAQTCMNNKSMFSPVLPILSVWPKSYDFNYFSCDDANSKGGTSSILTIATASPRSCINTLTKHFLASEVIFYHTFVALLLILSRIIYKSPAGALQNLFLS